MPRRAVTLVEVVVALVAAALLSFYALFMIASVREAARRMRCADNLKQIGLALHHYADHHHGYLPAFRSQFVPGFDTSWRLTILPYLEQGEGLDSAGAEQAYLGYRTDADTLRRIVETSYPVYQCPSTPGAYRVIDNVDIGKAINVRKMGARDYTGVFSVGDGPAHPGAFFGPSPKQAAATEEPLGTSPGRFSDIKDGLSHTAIVVEQAGLPTLQPHDRPACDRYPPVMGNKNYMGAWPASEWGILYSAQHYRRMVDFTNCGGLYAWHVGVTVAGFCDGSVRTLSCMNSEVVAMLTREDGDVVSKP